MLAHGCKFKVEELDGHHHPSPLTHGGLGIKSRIIVEWAVIRRIRSFSSKTLSQRTMISKKKDMMTIDQSTEIMKDIMTRLG